MRFFRTPAPVQFLLNKMEWRVQSTEKVLYLTFDDGPIPVVTDFVLNQLQQYKAKATFFCVGENLMRNPGIAQRILENGHKIGNHTHNHIKGWETGTEAYLENIKRCQNSIEDLKKPEENVERNLFRPPYGRISKSQIKALLPNYRIIMWDVLTYDFDAALAPEVCLKNSVSLSRPGSIVVFHDSLKARKNLEYVLPRYLQHFHDSGYRFEML